MNEKGYNTMNFNKSNIAQFEAQSYIAEIINQSYILSITKKDDIVSMWSEVFNKMSVEYFGKVDLHICLGIKLKSEQEPEQKSHSIKDILEDKRELRKKVLGLITEFETKFGVEIKTLAYQYRIEELEDEFFKYQKQVKIDLDI